MTQPLTTEELLNRIDAAERRLTEKIAARREAKKTILTRLWIWLTKSECVGCKRGILLGQRWCGSKACFPAYIDWWYGRQK